MILIKVVVRKKLNLVSCPARITRRELSLSELLAAFCLPRKKSNFFVSFYPGSWALIACLFSATPQITLKMGLNVDHLLQSFIFVLPADITKGILNYLFSQNEQGLLYGSGE